MVLCHDPNTTPDNSTAARHPILSIKKKNKKQEKKPPKHFLDAY